MGRGWVDRIVRTDQEIGAAPREPVGRGQHEIGNPGPVSGINAAHIRGERVSVHRELGVSVRPKQLRALGTNCSIAKGGGLSGTRDGAYVRGHGTAAAKTGSHTRSCWSRTARRGPRDLYTAVTDVSCDC